MKRNRIVVDPALAAVLARVGDTAALLDYEKGAPAIPIWAGTRPYDAVPVQFSCHSQTRRGLSHHAWLVESGRDPRSDNPENSWLHAPAPRPYSSTTHPSSDGATTS